MMAATRAERRAQKRRRTVVVGLALVLGLSAGLVLAASYPPPTVQVLQTQAVQWTQQMWHQVIPDDTPHRAPWSSDPRIYALPPIAAPAATPGPGSDEDVATLVDVTAPEPQPKEVQRALDTALEDLTLDHRMVVVDAATGKTLYDRAGDTSVVPASTVKLFTGLAVLSQLDGDQRFRTSAAYTPQQGVTLIGGGDGLLSLSAGTGETVGYAGLADLAADTWQQLRQELSPSQTTIDVSVDISRYAGPWTHPEWSDDLMQAGWVSPVYPLNTYGGFTGPPETSHSAVEDGATLAARTFAQHLSQQAATDGHDVRFAYAGRKSAPQDTDPVASVYSATLQQQLTYAMKQSNNMLFEMFGREAALAAGQTPDFAGSTATTLTTMAEFGMETSTLTFVDNSGLSPDNRATLQQTIDVLELMLTHEQYRPLFDTLTVAGYDGTMRYRLDQAPYAGIVQSKTGTLRVASSNAGLTVTDDGRALFFAINTAGADGDYAAARAEQDRLVEVLTDCGCTPPTAEK